MNNQEQKDLHAAETAFKRRLLELGMLTKITTPASAVARKRTPVPVSGNAISKAVIRERR